MKRAEWQEIHNITDEEFERIDFFWKLFGGKISEVENPPLDYDVVKYNK